jgi:hypothetical protein
MRTFIASHINFFSQSLQAFIDTAFVTGVALTISCVLVITGDVANTVSIFILFK